MDSSVNVSIAVNEASIRSREILRNIQHMDGKAQAIRAAIEQTSFTSISIRATGAFFEMSMPSRERQALVPASPQVWMPRAAIYLTSFWF